MPRQFSNPANPAVHEATTGPEIWEATAGAVDIVVAGFVPANYDASVVDAVETVSAAEAFHWARRLAREEGLLVGISTGANVAVAARLAMQPRNAGKTIVTFACSSGERYLSTPLYQLVGMPGSSSALDVTSWPEV